MLRDPKSSRKGGIRFSLPDFKNRLVGKARYMTSKALNTSLCKRRCTVNSEGQARCDSACLSFQHLGGENPPFQASFSDTVKSCHKRKKKTKTKHCSNNNNKQSPQRTRLGSQLCQIGFLCKGEDQTSGPGSHAKSWAWQPTSLTQLWGDDLDGAPFNFLVSQLHTNNEQVERETLSEDKVGGQVWGHKPLIPELGWL